jgi:DNA uptake protein ComE-like DNA-binding protein
MTPLASRQRAADRSPRAARPGSVLIVTMWAIIAITGVVLTMSYSMRIEAIASANRLAQVQAGAAERGAEQFVCYAVDNEVSTPGFLDQLSFEGRQIGDCFVWIVRPDWDDDQQPAYGLLDEAGKIDLNTASAATLLNLPGMTEDVADAIVDWRDADSTPGAQGAEDDYYLSLPEPYRCKNASFDTVEELLLVKGVTKDLLYGYDRNRNGTIDQKESASGNLGDLFNSTNGTGRGIFPFVTAYGIQASGSATSSTSGSSGSSSSSTSAPVNVNSQSQNSLRTLLTANVDGSRVNQLLNRTQEELQTRTFRNVFDYYFRVNMTMEEFTKLYPHLDAAPASGGPTSAPAAPANVAKINVNTAPREVLLCLTGMEDAAATTIISHRQATTEDPSNIAWLADSVITRANARRLGSQVTGKSLVYSADIVALSPDGRAFRRSRIVVSGATTPSKIIYRRDLTSSGWPLPPEIRAAIRAGEQYQAPMTSGGIVK